MNYELSIEELAAVHGGTDENGISVPYPAGPNGDIGGWVKTDIAPSEVAGGAALLSSGPAAVVLGFVALVLNHFGD